MEKERAHADVKASDIMTHPVEVVQMEDSIHDVARLFTEKNIGAAAVLDKKGKPVGVITKTDLIRSEKERDSSRSLDKHAFSPRNGELKQSGFHLIEEEETVRNWMTPVIFAVKPETPMKEVARRMVGYGIHHIFVQLKNDYPLMGIVSSFDVLRRVAVD